MLKALLIATLPVLFWYLYTRLRYKRFRQYASLPQLPSSLVLGHLAAFDEYNRRGPPAQHPDMIFTAMHAAIGRPPLMLVDFRPVTRPMVLVASHEIAEQIAKPSKQFPTSVPKASLKHLAPLLGATSILTAQDDEWKALRKRFNPGFAPQHLMTLLPDILDKTAAFVERLDSLAGTGEDFSLASAIVDLTFDVIGAVVMDVDLDAQKKQDGQGELIKLFRELLGCYADDKADYPWWIIPRIELQRRRLGKTIDALLKDIVRRKYADYSKQPHEGGQSKAKSRSILQLSFQNTTTLTPELLSETADQLKTFLLAGHDTTSITLAWVFYELSRTPSALDAVRAELDGLFGREAVSPEAVRARLLTSEGPDLLRRMEYISAVIKEALRLHPPAATARSLPPGSGWTVRTPDGVDHCLDGALIYNCPSIMHRDPAVYGDSADMFRPERWLTAGGNEDPAGGIPLSAWRPFERGPRNCIGQEFATIEARVIVAVVARRYEFIKVGLGELAEDEKGVPMLGDGGRFKVKSELYTTRQVTVKPIDGMRMKVKFAMPS
ncbi:Cytochrome P450 [Naviculisporaceae sp. PSN 640]